MIKQVIVIRKDLKMRRGKEIAQGSHASSMFLLHEWNLLGNIIISEVEQEWLQSGFPKVVCRVNSEQELLELYEHALDLGLASHIVQDEGRTEFNGVPTYTALAIGPDYSEKIDPVTSHLELY